MEKYENIIKIEEIRRLAENKDYILAAQIVDTMDISKVKANTDLSTIADVFIKRERYDEALDVLNKMYEKSVSRRVVYQLLEVSIKTKDISLSKRYYDEYIELAPKDTTRYIFEYQIKRLENRPIEEQITPLKELKKYEYIEEWAYELATLYHQANMKEECMEECKDIIIWFGDGEYVRKAELLKAYHEGKVDLFELLNDTEGGNQQVGQDIIKEEAIDEEKEEIKEELEENETLEEKPLIVDKLQAREHEVEENVLLVEEKEMNEDSLIAKDIDEEEEELETKEVELKVNQIEKDELGKDELEEVIPKDTDENVNESISTKKPTRTYDDLLEDFFASKDIKYKEIFGEYLNDKGNKRQILEVLQEIKNNDIAYNNLVITTSDESDKEDNVSFAKAILKAMYKLEYIMYSKVGVIDAKAFNKIDSAKKKRALRNCSLIIERADLLDNNAIDEIENLVINKDQGILFVFQGNKNDIDKLFKEHPQLYLYFHVMISL